MLEQQSVAFLLKKFSSTISGRPLLYITRSKKVWKLKWIIIWLFLFSLTFWSCALNLEKYLKFDTKVSLTFDSQSEIQFPAVSFCNQFALSKAAVGSNKLALLIYTGLFADTMEEIWEKFAENLQRCQTHLTPETAYVTQDNNIGIMQLQKIAVRSSTKSVIKCWWHNEEIETRGIFMNQLLDTGACFTFMPNKEEAYNYMHSDFSKIMYGLNESLVMDKLLTNSGPTNGLRMLLNVEQSDQCDTTRKYEGEGYRAVVHDYTLYKPTFSMLPSIALIPGFEISVMLKPVKYIRQTSDLGKCQEPNYFRGKNKYYFKTDCINACFIKKVFLECNCFPEVVTGLENFFTHSLGFNVTLYGNCDQKHIKCLKEQQFNTFRAENPSISCPVCLEPCYETKYDSLVTYKQFPSANSYKYVTQVLNRSQSIQSIRKNYLLVNFYLESMTVLKVVESQASTIRGMFIFFGCKIGLLLGLSFMSLGEVCQLMSELSYLLIKKIRLRATLGKRLHGKFSIRNFCGKRNILAPKVDGHLKEKMVKRDSVILQHQGAMKVKQKNVIFIRQLTMLKHWKHITNSKVQPAHVIFTTRNQTVMDRRATIRDININVPR